MSISSTLTPLNSELESLKKASNDYYATSNNNNSSFDYEYLSQQASNEMMLYQNRLLTNADDALLLEQLKSLSQNATPTKTTFASNALSMHKSNSYSGSSGNCLSTKLKATVIKQESASGDYAIGSTLQDEGESDYGDAGLKNASSAGNMCIAAATPTAAGAPNCTPIDLSEEYDSFLPSTSSAASSCSASRRNSSRSHGKSRNSCCVRTHAFITRNWYLSYLVPISILLALMVVAYLTRDYAKRMLYWIETQNPWIIFGMFMLLFVIVSFPVVVGYFILMITAGYLFGFLRGLATVLVGANLGIAIAHVTIRSFRHKIPMHKIIKNETGRAILRVISGPRAFKVVLFTRLTPIPFGIQNAIFGVSSINPRVYHAATVLGLLPAQTINVYLGSTLRSMHEVLNNHGTAVTGYISFGVEVICGVALMFWVVQKARKELSQTLLSDITADGKMHDIQV